jgi:hypothetical protein
MVISTTSIPFFLFIVFLKGGKIFFIIYIFIPYIYLFYFIYKKFMTKQKN